MISWVSLLLLQAATTPADAERLYADLEYDRVIPVARKALEAPDLEPNRRLRLLYLLGTCLAIVGDDVGAQRPFRLIVRRAPDFQLPGDTPPRALAVFKLVAGEEAELRDQLEAMQREQMLAELEVTGGPPKAPEGGVPLPFELRVTDPRDLVKQVSVSYRRASTTAFSSLALSLSSDGTWRGEIPADWTASEHQYQLEWYATTVDGEGAALKSLASADQPNALQVEAGLTAAPFYLTPWFWSVVGVAVAGAATATVFGIRAATAKPDTPVGNFELD